MSSVIKYGFTTYCYYYIKNYTYKEKYKQDVVLNSSKFANYRWISLYD